MWLSSQADLGLGPKQPQSRRPADRLGPVGRVQFLQDVTDVRLNCAGREDQRLGDSRCGRAAGQFAQYLALSGLRLPPA